VHTGVYARIYVYICMYDRSPFEVDGQELGGLGLGSVGASAVAFPHRPALPAAVVRAKALRGLLF